MTWVLNVTGMLRPRVIHLVGPGGAGKSTVGHALARRQVVAFIDLDEEFKARAGDITNDSTFPELGPSLTSRGARVIFVPTNNALPKSKPSSDLVLAARACDIALATANHCWVVRADVGGVMSGLRSEESSALISPAGKTVSSARALNDDLLVAEIDLVAV